MMSAWSALAGWLGASALLLAYILLVNHRVRADDLTFIWLNLTGSAGLVINGTTQAAWPSATLNTIWLIVGLTGHVRRQHKQTTTGRSAPPWRPPA